MAVLILVDLEDFVIANRAQLFIWCGGLAIDNRQKVVPLGHFEVRAGSRRRGQDTPANSVMLYELIAVVGTLSYALYESETNIEIGPSGLHRRGQGVRFHPLTLNKRPLSPDLRIDLLTFI